MIQAKLRMIPQRFALSIMLIFGMHTSTVSQLPSDNHVSGTYKILFCERGCVYGDSTRAYTKGFLVLLEDSILRSRLNGEQRAAYDKGSSRDLPHESPNACFMLVTSSSQGAVSGALPLGFSRWTRSADGVIKLTLYRSPDSGYSIQLEQRDGRWVGVGEYWTSISSSQPPPVDSVSAKRIGDAQIRNCRVGSSEL